MSNVLFLNTDYLPDFEESKRLEKWQHILDSWRAELAYMYKKNNLSPGQIALSKMRFHNGVRENWKVYTGFKKESKEA